MTTKPLREMTLRELWAIFCEYDARGNDFQLRHEPIEAMLCYAVMADVRSEFASRGVRLKPARHEGGSDGR